MTRKAYYTIEEVADLLRVSDRTIRRWVKEMGLPHFRMGNTLRFPVAGVNDWIEEHSKQYGEEEGEV